VVYLLFCSCLDVRQLQLFQGSWGEHPSILLSSVCRSYVDNPCHIWRLRKVPPLFRAVPRKAGLVSCFTDKKRRASHVPKAVLTISQVVAIVGPPFRFIFWPSFKCYAFDRHLALWVT
jgi:hypothetical protein